MATEKMTFYDKEGNETSKCTRFRGDTITSNVSLPAKLYTQIKVLADLDARTFSGYIRKICEEHLESKSISS